MNSRILKKLCKRAEQYTEAFLHLEKVDDGTNDPISIVKFDQKHKEKWCRTKLIDSDYIQFFNNTPSYGTMSGGFEPEWEDTPAYFILKDIFLDAYTEYSEKGIKYCGPKRPSPSVIFSYFGV